MGIKGLDTLADILDVVRSPDKYDAKVKELKALVSQYTEVAEAVVKLADVNDYTQNIKRREEESKSMLDKVKDQIVKQQQAAQADIELRMKKVRESEAIVSKSENDLLARQSKLDEEARNQSKEASALLAWKQILDKRESDLAQAEIILAEKQAKLKAALA